MRTLAQLLDLAGVAPPLDGILAETLSAAMQVHARFTTDAPAVPVVVDPLYPGLYSIDVDGRPSGISINPAVDRPRLTFLHEVGHFIDHALLGNRQLWASTRPEFEPWRGAISATDAYAELLRQQARPPLPQLRRLMEYLLKTEELFARSYSEWIAIRSGNEALRDELDRSLSRLSYPEYWGMDDFDPVAKALDRVFDDLMGGR